MEIEYGGGDHIQPKFGHYVIKWTIENYCLATCKEDCRINSPEFYIAKPCRSKWKMIVNPKSKVNGVFYAIFYLQRLDPKVGHNDIWVNWKLCLLDSKESRDSEVECEHFFENESTCGVYLQRTDYIINKLRPFDLDTLRIRCQLIVHRDDAVRNIAGPSDVGIESLSKALSFLCVTGNFCDVALQVNGKNINAHRAILYYRNSILANILEKRPEKVVKISTVDYKAMTKVISYLYSGNLEFVLDKPSIALYECVTYLNIDEIKSYYVPNEFNMRTAVNSQEFFLLWPITDFSTKANDDVISGPIIKKTVSGISWRLSVHPKGSEESSVQHIAIIAEIVEGKKAMGVCLEFAIMGTNGELFCLKRHRKYAEGRISFVFKEFIKKDLLGKTFLLAEDTLRLVFKIRASNGEQTTSLGSHIMSFITSNADKQSYKSLSADMKRMSENGKFSDLTLIAEEKHFHVHKCVLQARSEVFSLIMNSLSEKRRCISIPNIKSSLLKILISYMYSGILKDFNMSDVPQIYKAAQEYKILALKDTCSLILQNSIHVKNVCDILEFAECRCDRDLKLSALKFIRLHSQEVFRDPIWRIFSSKNKALSTEVHEFMRKNQSPAPKNM